MCVCGDIWVCCNYVVVCKYGMCSCISAVCVGESSSRFLEAAADSCSSFIGFVPFKCFPGFDSQLVLLVQQWCCHECVSQLGVC